MGNKLQAYYAEQEAQERKKLRQKMRKETYQWLGECDTSALATKTFQTFDQTRQQPAYDAVKEFAVNPEGHLVLRGSSGTGKTHLLVALCNELRTRRENPLGSRFASALSLFHALQESMRSGCTDMTYTDLIHKAIATRVLVLDDIDKAKWSEFRGEALFEILDGRTMNGRPTVLSTNREDIVQYIGIPCASRLSIGLIEVDMVGGDYRREVL